MQRALTGAALGGAGSLVAQTANGEEPDRAKVLEGMALGAGLGLAGKYAGHSVTTDPIRLATRKMLAGTPTGLAARAALIGSWARRAFVNAYAPIDGLGPQARDALSFLGRRTSIHEYLRQELTPIFRGVAQLQDPAWFDEYVKYQHDMEVEMATNPRLEARGSRGRRPG